MEKSLINEKDVLLVVGSALNQQIENQLKGYSSPLIKIVSEVVQSYEDKIKKIVNDALSETLNSDEFVKVVKDEFSHKVAKSLVGKLEGSVEKAVEVLRQDQAMRARMILAIENIVNENTTEHRT